MPDVSVQMVIQRTADGVTEETRHDYPAKAFQKAGGWFFSYTESLEAIGEVSTVLKIGETAITLLRQGNLQMKQTFERGRSSQTSYLSPYGRLMMEIHTYRLKIARSDSQPSGFTVHYQLWLNGEYVGHYQWETVIRWQGQDVPLQKT